MPNTPTERILGLLQDITEFQEWMEEVIFILDQHKLEVPPLPSFRRFHDEIGYRRARGGQAGFEQRRLASRRYRIRRSDPEVTSPFVRGRTHFSSLSPEQEAKILDEIAEIEGQDLSVPLPPSWKDPS